MSVLTRVEKVRSAKAFGEKVGGCSWFRCGNGTTVEGRSGHGLLLRWLNVEGCIGEERMARAWCEADLAPVGDDRRDILKSD